MTDLDRHPDRLSTIRHAGRIHVLHDGRIVEAGTHDALLAADGRYAALSRVQTGAASSAESRMWTPAPR